MNAKKCSKTAKTPRGYATHFRFVPFHVLRICVSLASSRVISRAGPRCVRSAKTVGMRNTRGVASGSAFKETTVVVPDPEAFLESAGESSRFRNCTATWHASAIGICSTRLPE